MTKDDQIIAALEEVANQLKELKKLTASNPKPDEIHIKGVLLSIEEKLQKSEAKQHSMNLNVKGIGERIANIGSMLSPNNTDLTHKYIEIKNPHWWLLGVATYFFVSVLSILLLYNRSADYKERLTKTMANDIKYRLLKVQSEPLSNFREVAKNTTELIYFIDTYYESDPTEVETYVIEREEHVRKAFEAAELAKQKEIEAKAARDEAERLKLKD